MNIYMVSSPQQGTCRGISTRAEPRRKESKTWQSEWDEPC